MEGKIARSSSQGALSNNSSGSQFATKDTNGLSRQSSDNRI